MRPSPIAFAIETLRGEFTDALMMRDYDRFAPRWEKTALISPIVVRRARRPGL